MSDVLEQAQACADRGNQYPFCSPLSTDVWANGTTQEFIWNYNYPFYVGYEKVSLYLYYIVQYQYVSVKNYTDLDRANGGTQVTVDSSWFLSPLPAGSLPQNLTMAGFYLPSEFSPYNEISSPISMFPRPFNFTVTQFAVPANGTNNGNSTNNSTNNNGNNNNNNNNSNNHLSSSSSSLPGWAIAVIVLAVIAFICGTAALIWTMLLSRRNRRSNKLIPMAGASSNNNNNNNHHNIIGGSSGRGKYSHDNASINSQTKVNAFRSTDSVPMTTTSAAENASSVGTLTSRQTYAQPFSPSYENNNSNHKLSSNDAVFLADSFRNTLGRSTQDWNTTTAPIGEDIGGEEEEEMKRRRLGEALLQRQLEEDGTSVKHAGRFTRVKSLADIQKSAVFEQPPKY